MKSFKDFVENDINESKIAMPKAKDVDKLIELIKKLSLNKFNKVYDFVQKLDPSADSYYSGKILFTTNAGIPESTRDFFDPGNKYLDFIENVVLKAKNYKDIIKGCISYPYFLGVGRREFKFVKSADTFDEFTFKDNWDNIQKMIIYKN